MKLRESHSRRSTPHTHTCWLAVFPSVTPTDNIILFSLVAADGQVCNYRPTSETHRYIPIPPPAVSILRCQLVISEMTNSERCGGVIFPRPINNSSWGKHELRRVDGWQRERKRPPAGIICTIYPVCLHYPWSIARQDALTAHASNSWAWRQVELRIAERIIACLIWSVSPEKSAG